MTSFLKLKLTQKFLNGKYKSTSLSILYGGSANKDVHDFNFKLNGVEKKQAKIIAKNIENSISQIVNKNNQSDLFDDNQNIILGAISEYISNNIKLVKDD